MKNENGGDPSSLSQSWRERQAAQQPAYSEGADLDGVLAHLRRLPPLVTSWEVEALRGQLAEAAAGRRYACPGEREAPAYRAQADWLAQTGSSLERDFGIDDFFLKAVTICWI